MIPARLATRANFRHRMRVIRAEREWVRKVEAIMRPVAPEVMAGVRLRLRKRRPWRLVHP
jgi:hypothetical protein